MQLCFVSVHGPRETYFVDEPRMLESSAIRPQECFQLQLPFRCRLQLLIRKYS
jgi:hypothetical protein